MDEGPEKGKKEGGVGRECSKTGKKGERWLASGFSLGNTQRKEEIARDEIDLGTFFFIILFSLFFFLQAGLSFIFSFGCSSHLSTHIQITLKKQRVYLTCMFKIGSYLKNKKCIYLCLPSTRI